MRNTGKIVATGIVVAILVLAVIGSVALSGENIVRDKGPWTDATDFLSLKAAAEANRKARPPLINTEQGNMLVFFFALGGVTAGFITGYNWRSLMTEKVKGR